MGFNDEIKQFAERTLKLTESISTEEATKMSMIMPLFQLLGYDIFNPAEFCPEFTADVGVKKGEKVDYAILIDNEPQILVECKWCGEDLNKHSSQLFRYFGTSKAKFGILTNGVIYKFFTDLEETNKMDLKPFLIVDLANLNDNVINEMKKFSKESFDRESIFSTASELKYSSMLKNKIKEMTENPDDDLIRYMIKDIYEGQKNQKILDKFKPIVKRSFTMYFNDIVNNKISAALTPDEESADEDIEVEPNSKIVTTEEEMQAYYIIKGILAGATDISNVTFRDTESYFGILFGDNSRKPICRINLDTKKKQILIPDENKEFTRYYIESLNDLYQYKEELVKVVGFYN